MMLEVALTSPVPLAVSVVVPTATPVICTVLDVVPPTAMVAVAGTLATPGALLVRSIGLAFIAVWFPEYEAPGSVR